MITSVNTRPVSSPTEVAAAVERMYAEAGAQMAAILSGSPREIETVYRL